MNINFYIFLNFSYFLFQPRRHSKNNTWYEWIEYDKVNATQYQTLKVLTVAGFLTNDIIPADLDLRSCQNDYLKEKWSKNLDWNGKDEELDNKRCGNC